MPLMEGAIDTVVALRRGRIPALVSLPTASMSRLRQSADESLPTSAWPILMHFRNGTATGELTFSPLMLDAEGCRKHDCCKSNVIRHLQATAGLVPKHTLAVGDGDSDICMLRDAGFSVAFRPKSKLVEKAAKHTLSRSLLDMLDLLPSAHPLEFGRETRIARPRSA